MDAEVGNPYQMARQGNYIEEVQKLSFHVTKPDLLHSPEEVASGPRILCWVMFFHYLSLASLNGLVL